MKISLLGPDYPYRGGIVQFNSSLVNSFREREDVELRTVTWSKLYPEMLLPKPAAEFKDSESKSVLGLKDVDLQVSYTNPLTWLKLVKDIKKQEVNLFITHWQQPVQFPVYFVLFTFVKLFTKSDILLIVHNVVQHEDSFISRTLTKIILKLPSQIVTHSKLETENASNICDISKVITSFLPLNNLFEEPTQSLDQFRESLGIHEADKVLLYFGFIRPYKGVEYLIGACKDLREKYPKMKVIVAGEMFWEKEGKGGVGRVPYRILKAITTSSKQNSKDEYAPLKGVEENSLEGFVILRNSYIPNEDVAKYFKISDALVLPYLSASQSGPVQIAYQFNLPVLASDVGGLKDSVEDGVSGIKFDPGSSSSIIDAVGRFYNSSENWEENVKKYKENFSWNKYTDLIINKYEKSISSNS